MNLSVDIFCGWLPAHGAPFVRSASMAGVGREKETVVKSWNAHEIEKQEMIPSYYCCCCVVFTQICNGRFKSNHASLQATYETWRQKVSRAVTECVFRRQAGKAGRQQAGRKHVLGQLGWYLSACAARFSGAMP